jgi:tetratricopeptide (TPR) repeat protein
LAAQDVIKLQDGTEIKGKITGLDADVIAYTDAKGAAAKVKNEAVKEYVLSDTPTEYRKACAAMTQRDPAKAIKDCQAALDVVAKGKARGLHKQFIYLKMAQAQSAKGDHDAALEPLQKLRQECGRCRVRSESFRESLRIAKQKGGGAAEAVIGEMKSEAEPTASLADLEAGKLKFERSEFDGAAEAFKRVADKTGNPHAGEAAAWTIRCLQRANKTDELAKFCEQSLAVGAAAPPILIQAAASALGHVALAQAEKDKTKVRDAVVLFAQAISVGPPAKGEPPDDYARALLGAARGHELMSAGLTDSSAKQDYVKRAVDYYKEVAGAYPGTEWAKSADTELTRLGQPPRGGSGPPPETPPK